MFPIELNGGGELFSGQIALAAVIGGVAIFQVFLLVIALMHAVKRKKVVIPYLPTVVGEHGLLLLLIGILAVLLGATYLTLLLWPPPHAG